MTLEPSYTTNMYKSWFVVAAILVLSLMVVMLLPRSENKIEVGMGKQFLIFPGMMAPEESFYPLVRYLREEQSEYGVAVIPLRLSAPDFNTIVEEAARHISDQFSETPHKLILFGHSHGGRVAGELAIRLKSLYPATDIIVVTAGTPMVKQPDYLPWHYQIVFGISSAWRSWPPVSQPDSSVVSRLIGYYSTEDQIVIPEYAKYDYSGELIELQGMSHHDLSVPSKIGPYLLEFMTSQ